MISGNGGTGNGRTGERGMEERGMGERGVTEESGNYELLLIRNRFNLIDSI